MNKIINARVMLAAIVLVAGPAWATRYAPLAAAPEVPEAVPATPSGPSATKAERAGFLKSVDGQVEVIDAAGLARPASPGDALAATEQVVTSDGAGAGVVLRDGTVLVIGPSSRLDLKEYSYDGTTHEGGMLVQLLRGSMRMVSGLIGKSHPEAVRVETQTATIGIRGTDFIVTAGGQSGHPWSRWFADGVRRWEADRRIGLPAGSRPDRLLLAP